MMNQVAQSDRSPDAVASTRPAAVRELRYRFPCIFSSEYAVVFHISFEFQSDA